MEDEMKKNFRFVVVLMMSFLLILSSCDFLGSIFQPKTPPEAPSSISAVADVEEIDVSWTASEGAESYNLYYTSDGTNPTLESKKVSPGNVTNYSLSDLTWSASALTYTFAVTAVGEGGESDLSPISSKVRPIPTIEVRLTGGTPNKKMLLKVFKIENGGDNDILDDKTYKGFETDASGDVILKAPFDRDYLVGFSLIYDEDNSGDLSTNDIVHGSGENTALYGYTYFTDLKDKSFYIAKASDDLNWYTYTGK